MTELFFHQVKEHILDFLHHPLTLKELAALYRTGLCLSIEFFVRQHLFNARFQAQAGADEKLAQY